MLRVVLQARKAVLQPPEMNQDLPHSLKIPAVSDVPPSVMFPLIDSSFTKIFWKKDSLTIFITLSFFSELLRELHSYPIRMGSQTISWIFSPLALHLESFMFEQAPPPKATLETLSLHHCLKSVPDGPGWGLTGPLLSSTKWVNCSLHWNTNKLQRLYISQEKQQQKSYGFSNKVNFKKYPLQDAIWNANTKPVFSQSLNIKNDLKVWSGSLEDVRLIVIWN